MREQVEFEEENRMLDRLFEPACFDTSECVLKKCCKKYKKKGKHCKKCPKL